MELADHLLRFAAVGQTLFLAGLFLRELRGTLLGGLGALFSFGVAAYLVCSSPDLGQALGPGRYSVVFFCIGNPVFFWLFTRALFDDEFRLAPIHGVFLALLEGLVLWRLLAPLDPAGPVFAISTILSKVVGLAFIIVALAQAFTGRSMDLVEARRRFRLVFVGATGGYMIIVVTAELILGATAPSALLQVVNAGGILALAVFISFSIVRLRASDLLTAEPQSTAPPERHRSSGIDPPDQPLLESLNRLFEDEHVYRREGLTIGGLAEMLGSQEHRLRRLINKGLGFRNFNAFLNAYRIAEACTALADAERARLPVLTIAMDLGYGSLGPFNRAFKTATGKTPTEYRRQTLADLT